jgi:hypothetical protein
MVSEEKPYKRKDSTTIQDNTIHIRNRNTNPKIDKFTQHRHSLLRAHTSVQCESVLFLHQRHENDFDSCRDNEHVFDDVDEYAGLRCDQRHSDNDLLNLVKAQEGISSA